MILLRVGDKLHINVALTFDSLPGPQVVFEDDLADVCLGLVKEEVRRRMHHQALVENSLITIADEHKYEQEGVFP